MSSQKTKTATWAAADWGTSHLRLWPMDATGMALTRIDSDRGMGAIVKDDYESVLIAQLEPYLPTTGTMPVVVCGMAGSRQGWAEAPYSSTPCPPPSLAESTKVPTVDARLSVHILPGVKQVDPADVMRGEETQIAGVLAANPDLDGVICLPGTHTKWVSVSDGQIERFTTFMSGEAFHLISSESVLRHTLAEDGWDEAAFAKGCEIARKDPAALLSAMFSLRAEALLADLDPVAARARLSGLLVGAEVEAARPSWSEKTVIIVGETGMASAYAAALSLQGADAKIANAEKSTLAGLCAAYAHLNQEV